VVWLGRLYVGLVSKKLSCAYHTYARCTCHFGQGAGRSDRGGGKEGKKEGRSFVLFGWEQGIICTELYVADGMLLSFFSLSFSLFFFFPFSPTSGKLVKNGLGHGRCGRANVCALVD